MKCIYCSSELVLQSPEKCSKICMSKNCIAQFAFDNSKFYMNIYKPAIQEFLLELADSASYVPARFDPIPIGYEKECFKKATELNAKFINYLELSLGNVGIIEDPFRVDSDTCFISYTFDYSNDPWENFTYLFHGSPFHNWHSIVRKGLKNYSGTNKMTSGEAYGPGIYFSDNLSFSFAYTGGNSKKYAIGIFEVKAPNEEQKTTMKILPVKYVMNDFTDHIREIYQKNSNIFVVPFEENVRLKYLVVIPDMNDLKTFSSLLIKYFVNRLQKSNSILTKLNVLSSKRLMKERKSIQEMFPDMEIKEDVGRSWLCYYKNIQFEISFPTNYPINAPNIRILSPQSINHPNLYKGNVCMEPLYNWHINNKLDHIVLTFIHEIVSCLIINTPSISEQSWTDIRNALEMTKYL